MTTNQNVDDIDENKRLRTLRKAMRAELDRSMKRLSLPGHPKPYFISYLVRDTEKTNVWGRYGAVSRSNQSRKRFCFADVRVGSYQYDQVVQGGLHDNDDSLESYEYRELPKEDDPEVIRFNLWRLTDSKYREAIEHFHQRKLNEVNYLDENKGIPAFQKAKSDKSQRSAVKLNINIEDWEQYVREVGRSLKKYPALKNSYLDFTALTERKLFISSEDVERQWTSVHLSLSAYLWVLSKKGDQESNIVINTGSLDELPSVESFSQRIHDQIDKINRILGSAKMVSFSGPALLAPIPAGLLVHEVLGHRLEGSRLLSDEEGKTFSDKVGKKITHEDLTIYDDPTIKSWQGQSLTGSYDFDDEGSKPQRALLVDKGKLRGFLTTRSPIKRSGHKNNGHARAETFERPISRMGNTIVKAENGKSWEELKQLLIDQINERELPFGMILYEVEGGETGTEAYDFQAFMGEIKIACRVYPDGKEEFVRGVDFVGTPLAALSNVIAVGKDLEVDNAYCGAESGSIPVSTVSPAILLKNLELQAKDMSRLTQYTLPLPWHDDKKS